MFLVILVVELGFRYFVFIRYRVVLGVRDGIWFIGVDVLVFES